MSDHNNISRRRFLGIVGMGAAAAALPSCVRNTTTADAPDADHRMTYRVNHNTNDTVSILGYGCMRYPTVKTSDEPDAPQEIDQEAVNQSIDLAIASGVNYFDTSPVYCKGRSEEATGIALSRHPRDKYFIATKLSNFAPSTWPREKSIAMFENSLRNLRTDYIDYLLLHAIGQPADGKNGMQAFEARYIENGILDYLKEQKQAGKIRNLGFSYHGDIAVFDKMLKMMDDGEIHWDFVQIQMNYVDWHHANEVNEVNTNAEYLYGELASRNIPVVIMEPLLGGQLANMPSSIVAKMAARRPDDTPATWAFRYAGTPEGVLTVLSGMTYIEHLQENLKTYSPLDPVTPEENDFLEQMASEYLMNETIPCTACKYCMPCPYGVDIPAVFAHYNKCIQDDHVTRDTRDPNYESSRRAFLVGYDRSVPRLRQADHCVRCGQCVSHCPQNISIPERMDDIDRYTNRLRNNQA